MMNIIEKHNSNHQIKAMRFLREYNLGLPVARNLDQRFARRSYIAQVARVMLLTKFQINKPVIGTGGRRRKKIQYTVE